MNKFILSLVLLGAQIANADLVQLTPGAKSISNVNISAGGTVKATSEPLATVGSGVRKKYLIGPFGAEVYVVQLMVSDATSYKKEKALETLKVQNTTALLLTMLTSLPAKKIYSAFEDGLSANSIDLDQPEIAEFLSAVQKAGEATSGKTVTLLFTKNSDGTEKLTYEDTAGKSSEITGASGFREKILSIWLGTSVPGDDGLVELKQQLLQ